MASQSYQLSFGVTVLVVFLCLILILVLLAAGLRAIFTLIFYLKHIWRSIFGAKTESDNKMSKSNRSRHRKEQYEDDVGHYADDEITDTTSDRSMDRFAHTKEEWRVIIPCNLCEVGAAVRALPNVPCVMLLLPETLDCVPGFLQRNTTLVSLTVCGQVAAWVACKISRVRQKYAPSVVCVWVTVDESAGACLFGGEWMTVKFENWETNRKTPKLVQFLYFSRPLAVIPCERNEMSYRLVSQNNVLCCVLTVF